MDIKEIVKLDIDKLNEKLTELRNKARELRFSIANNQLKNVRELRVVKKDIAKILMILNQQRISRKKIEQKVAPVQKADNK
ncbi:MAG: 50S ribosomal protein L29 [Candidatus Komeilibacteria bacterium CG11_big_fil_rev_8_21_14_0_20_36_20]|uniref:Large ribosomal subunit protein uL29 n=1 Tax=Candidatus Komeilibacteria bacterium CG11_big_fil_rev_8_21_14_0_20_36_20 TaxID=1974477 RepID=A0A2H0NDQ8_9BACT|nr:MAG: 50S ribosomal protein L29 [Candidatus Komeilibacteria bacterium CG11_big_fil_rev_8_21_14_0_20_36_20]PIR81398.1 MAG: 50S ribosomal protein L29 [Candidatus Komeilibacteria bacterium CG10_big_fil_rev_8_21_14_0_10_36_65]PJC55123.1 MAG: 50S ribosomal protein L29 [Candidatus Komeilibacteria bacterium CG_4_9_14_0_2_um_filter_36_13]